MSRWKKKNSRELARSTLFTFKEEDIVLPDGSEMTYTLLDLPDFAGCLSVHDGDFILVSNYRYPLDKRVLEIPAGFIEEDESPEETAKRELEEETGYKIESCEKLCEYNTIGGLSDQKGHLFFGRAELKGEPTHEKGEDLKIISMPIDDIYEKLEKREITHPHTQIALYRAKDFL